eukprot:snap_masked-scaffold_18-processed-gene-5.32-mRNA-1 protein AED:1.00 eAED:1.00 QI:0/-1/0/0/-1/1/1/0/1284
MRNSRLKRNNRFRGSRNKRGRRNSFKNGIATSNENQKDDDINIEEEERSVVRAANGFPLPSGLNIFSRRRTVTESVDSNSQNRVSTSRNLRVIARNREKVRTASRNKFLQQEFSLVTICENFEAPIILDFLKIHSKEPGFVKVLNETNDDGRTAAHILVNKNNLEAFKVLLSYKPNLNIIDKYNRTVLHVAAALKRNGAEFCSLIIKAGYENKFLMEVHDKRHRTPLRVAISKLLVAKISFKNNILETVKVLVESGSDVNEVSVKGRSYVHIAAYNNLLSLFSVLLNGGANLNAENRYKRTAVHLCIIRNHVEFLNRLIEAGADIDGKDIIGLTPLHLSVLYTQRNDPRCLKLLLENEVDLLAQTAAEETAFHYAAFFGKHSALVELLNSATSRFHVATISALVNSRNIEQESPLDVAILRLHLILANERLRKEEQFTQHNNSFQKLSQSYEAVGEREQEELATKSSKKNPEKETNEPGFFEVVKDQGFLSYIAPFIFPKTIFRRPGNQFTGRVSAASTETYEEVFEPENVAPKISLEPPKNNLTASQEGILKNLVIGGNAAQQLTNRLSLSLSRKGGTLSRNDLMAHLTQTTNDMSLGSIEPETAADAPNPFVTQKTTLSHLGALNMSTTAGIKTTHSFVGNEIHRQLSMAASLKVSGDIDIKSELVKIIDALLHAEGIDNNLVATNLLVLVDFRTLLKKTFRPQFPGQVDENTVPAMLLKHLGSMTASEAYAVYKHHPKLITHLFRNSYCNSKKKNIKLKKVLYQLKDNKARHEGKISERFYESLQKFTVAFIYEERDGPFWGLVNLEVKKIGLPPLEPVGIDDPKAGVRYTANILPCVVLLGETLADLGLSIESFRQQKNVLSILGLSTAALSMPFNGYLIWSSNNFLSDFAARGGEIMLFTILMSDISDSFYINSVGDIPNIGTFFAAFFPLLFPALEILVNLTVRKEHLASDIILLQCLGSFFMIVFHGTGFHYAQVVEKSGIENIYDLETRDGRVSLLLIFSLLITLVFTLEFARIVVSPQHISIDVFKTLATKIRFFLFQLYSTIYIFIALPLMLPFTLLYRYWKNYNDSLSDSNSSLKPTRVPQSSKLVETDGDDLGTQEETIFHSSDQTEPIPLPMPLNLKIFRVYRGISFHTVDVFFKEEFGSYFGQLLYWTIYPALVVDKLLRKNEFFIVVGIFLLMLMVPALFLLTTVITSIVVVSMPVGIGFTFYIVFAEDTATAKIFIVTLFARMLVILIFALWESSHQTQMKKSKSKQSDLDANSSISSLSAQTIKSYS